MEKDKVSVIIPTYNREKTILRSIESVLNQTYKNLEVIVVDDGSVDNTEKIIRKINDNRLFYYKLEKNSGCSMAKNYGIQKATGKYIAFQDSDDAFLKEKLKTQLDNMINEKSDMDFCKIIVHVGDETYFVPTIDDEKIIKKEGILNRLCNGNVISTQSIIGKAEIIKKALFDKETLNVDDYDLALRIVSEYKVSYTNKPLVELYRQDDSISNSMEKLKKASIYMIQKDYKLNAYQKEMLDNHLINQASRQQFEEYDILCLKIKKENNELKFDNELLNKKIKRIQKDHDILVKKCDELINYNQKLKNENNLLNEQLSNIINSKRWRFINKIASIKVK